MLHNRDEVIERAMREFAALDVIVTSLDAGAWQLFVPRPATDDAWTVKDALAHITARKQDFTGEVLSKPVSRGGLGVHAYNHATFEEWHPRPVDEVIEWHRRVQEKLLEALQNASDAFFAIEA